MAVYVGRQTRISASDLIVRSASGRSYLLARDAVGFNQASSTAWTPANLTTRPIAEFISDNVTWSGSTFVSAPNTGTMGGTWGIGTTALPGKAATAVNGHYGAAFTGGQGLRSSLSATVPAGSKQVFAVVRGLVDTHGALIQQNWAVNSGDVWYVRDGGKMIAYSGTSAGLSQYSGTVDPGTALRVLTVRFSTDGFTLPHQMRLNGVDDLSFVSDPTRAISSNTDDFWIGESGNHYGGEYLNGEVLYAMHGVGQTDAEIQKLEGWASWTYAGDGSLLPVGHPYKSAAPTVAATNSLGSVTNVVTAAPAITSPTAGIVSSGGGGTTFDPAYLAPGTGGIAYSNGNRTFTNGPTQLDRTARSVDKIGTGKRYIEVVLSAPGGSGSFNEWYMGIVTSTFNQGEQVGDNNGLEGSHTAYGSGYYILSNLGTLLSGDVVCYAMDGDADTWAVRKNNGPWFTGVGGVGGSNWVSGGDPTNPTNMRPAGIDISNSWFAVDIWEAGREATINTKATEWAYTPPTGYLAIGDTGGSTATDTLGTPTSVATAAPAITSPVVGQKHVLTGTNVATAAANVTSPAIAQTHGLGAVTNVATAAANVASPTLDQVHALGTATGIATSAPAMTSPAAGIAVGTDPLGIPNSVATASPAVASPSIGQKHALTGTNVSTAAATVTSPAITQVHALGTSAAVATAAPVVASPLLAQSHALTATAVATSSPAMTAPSVGQKHALTANPVSTASPQVSSPALGAIGQLLANPVQTSTPAITSPTMAQIHALVSNAIQVPAPALSSPAIGQKHALATVGVVTSSPAMGAPGLGQRHALGASPVVTSAPVLGTPVLFIPGTGYPIILLSTL